MAYALGQALLFGLVTLPITLILFAWVPRVMQRPCSERLLLAMVLTPVVAIVEVLGLSLVPIERPLDVLAWGHLGVLVLGVAAVGPRRCRDGVGELAARTRRVLGSFHRATRWVLYITLGVLAFAFVHAAWNAGDEHDGAMYRLLMVMQAVQDGRVGPVPYPEPHFADAYPRTIEYLYSWAMLTTGSSVGFHLVNWAFLCVFGLAAYVIARRCRLGRTAAALCAALTVTTPLPIYLTAILYNDVGAVAWFAAGIAFALSPRKGAWGRADLLACAVALALCGSAKLNMSIGCAVIVLVRLVHSLLPASRREGRVAVSSRAVLGAFLGAALIASSQYVRTWAVYGSPVWPWRLAVGGVVVFDGPFAAAPSAEHKSGSLFENWGAAVFELFNTTSQDANGTYGLFFAIAVVPVMAWLAYRAVRRPTLTVMLLALLMASSFVVPGSSTLRYTMHMLPICYCVMMLMIGAHRMRTPRHRFPVVIGVFVAVNSFDYARTVVKEVAAQLRWGVSLLDPERNRRWYYQFAFWEGSTHPETHAAVHERMNRGERLVYATWTFPGMLYDPWYTYAVEHRTVRFVEQALDGSRRVETEPGVAWLASLHDDGIDAVLVHAETIEDRTLSDPGSGYELVYDQPQFEPPRKARLYRRSD